jgi:hypothetical protein
VAKVLETEATMQIVLKSFRGLSMLLWLNGDRLFTIGTIIAGLLAGAFLGSVLVQP